MADVEMLDVGGKRIGSNDQAAEFVSTTGAHSRTGQMYGNGQINFALDASYFPGSAVTQPVINTPTITAPIIAAPVITAPVVISPIVTTQAVTPQPTATTTVPAGSETLSVVLSEDAWQGDAQAVVAVDGVTVFSGAVTAAHGGAGQTVSLGSFDASVAHTVAVTFTNDAYGGTASTDRNLYVQSVLVGGTSIGGAASLYSAGTVTQMVAATAPVAGTVTTPVTAPAVTLGSGPDSVTLGISEDAWQGDAQYVVTLDGAQIGGVQTATQPHGSGRPQQVTLQGDFSHGARTIGVQFLNDAYGGTATTDRNIYVDSVGLNGTDTGKSAALYSAGTSTFVVGSAPSIAPTATPTPAPTLAPTPVAAPVASPAPAINGYVVSTTGSDSNDGSQAHPFATLQHAADAMARSAVKTTTVLGGTYTQTLSLGSSHSGESFVAAANQVVTLTGSGVPTFITMNGASRVTLSGLTFAGSTGAAVSVMNGTASTITNDTFVNDWGGVMLGAGSDHIAVTNNKMTGTLFAGIEMKDGTNNDTIDSNLINGVGPVASDTYGGAIYAHGASSSQITHNAISNTAGAGINLSDFYTSGTGTQNLNDTIAYNSVVNADLTSSDSGSIYILGRSLAQTGTTVKMNFIDGTGSPSQHSVGIYLDDNANGVTITGNIVRNVGSDAVHIHGGSNNTVSGNIIDLGTGHASAVLFQANPADQPNPSPLRNNSVTGNIIQSASTSPGAFFVNLDGGSPLVSGNDFIGLAGVGLNTAPDTAPRYQNPGFANAAGANYAFAGGAGITFPAIDQSLIGLQPVGPHAY